MENEDISRLHQDEEEEEVVFRSPRNNMNSMLPTVKNPFRSSREYSAPESTVSNTDIHLEEVDVEAGRLNPMYDNDVNEASTTSHHSNSLVEMASRNDWKHEPRERVESEGGQSDSSGGRSSTVFFSFCPPFCRRNALKIGLSSFAVLLITLAVAFGIGR